MEPQRTGRSRLIKYTKAKAIHLGFFISMCALLMIIYQ